MGVELFMYVQRKNQKDAVFFLFEICGGDRKQSHKIYARDASVFCDSLAFS